jgi:hypothetical protein
VTQGQPNARYTHEDSHWAASEPKASYEVLLEGPGLEGGFPGMAPEQAVTSGGEGQAQVHSQGTSILNKGLEKHMKPRGGDWKPLGEPTLSLRKLFFFFQATRALPSQVLH